MNIGFTIGKFAPLHKGHEKQKKKGIAENDEFYILINDTNVTNISLETRAKWLKELFPKTHIILGKNPPKQYGMDEKSIKIQTDYLKDVFKDIPVTRFYSSEEYGKYVARDLGVEDRRVTKQIPISATLIRNDVETNKNYLENGIYKELKLFENKAIS